MRALLREPAPCRTSVLSGKSCSVATVALRLRPMAEEVVRPGESGGRYVCELLVSLPVSSA